MIVGNSLQNLQIVSQIGLKKITKPSFSENPKIPKHF